jgi:Kef-type K+ transport system membrane component KefB
VNGHSPLFEAFVYLVAAVAVVPVAKRLGLGAVLGYLIAGALLGPAALGLVGGTGGEDVLHFAEFGVVMMLFVVGLELEPALLWRLRAPILGLGGLQVVGTAAAVAGVALALGLRWQAAVAVGLTLALSSTAIVLQTLAEKGLLKTEGGQSTFSVLLFQDIAVIPILAVFPLLAPARGAAPGGGAAESATWVSGLRGGRTRSPCSPRWRRWWARGGSWCARSSGRSPAPGCARCSRPRRSRSWSARRCS